MIYNQCICWWAILSELQIVCCLSPYGYMLHKEQTYLLTLSYILFQIWGLRILLHEECFICISEYLKTIIFKTILKCHTQLCFYLKAACFGLDIDGHQAKKYTIIKRQVKNETYKNRHVLCMIPQFRNIFVLQ